MLKDSNYHAFLLPGQYFHVLLTLVAGPEWLNLFVFLIKKNEPRSRHIKIPRSMVLSVLVAGDKPNLFLKDKLNPRGLDGPRARFLRSLNIQFSSPGP